ILSIIAIFLLRAPRLVRTALEKPEGLSEPGCGAGLALLAFLSLRVLRKRGAIWTAPAYGKMRPERRRVQSTRRFMARTKLKKKIPFQRKGKNWKSKSRTLLIG